MTERPARKTIPDLVAVMAALRTPGTGCPWDLEQTFASIAPYTIEEAYEVADAIERGDMADLEEELGDLLLQVVYHARMAEEAGAFTFDDVADAITRKMIRRHPHVFGTAEERAAGATPGFWSRIKAAEKAEKAALRQRMAATGAPAANVAGTVSGDNQFAAASGSRSARQQSEMASLLDDVPPAMPALMRAIKLQDKAARVGFDWPSLAPVFDKMREELAELEEAALPLDPRGSTTAALSPSPLGGEGGRRPDEGALIEADTAAQNLPFPSPSASPSPSPREDFGAPPVDRSKIEEEFGDLLFVMANVARHLKLDPEAALSGANAKFTRRFHHIEQRLAEAGSSPAQSTLAEMDALWHEAKRKEREG